MLDALIRRSKLLYLSGHDEKQAMIFFGSCISLVLISLYTFFVIDMAATVESPLPVESEYTVSVNYVYLLLVAVLFCFICSLFLSIVSLCFHLIRDAKRFDLSSLQIPIELSSVDAFANAKIVFSATEAVVNIFGSYVGGVMLSKNLYLGDSIQRTFDCDVFDGEEVELVVFSGCDGGGCRYALSYHASTLVSKSELRDKLESVLPDLLNEEEWGVILDNMNSHK